MIAINCRATKSTPARKWKAGSGKNHRDGGASAGKFCQLQVCVYTVASVQSSTIGVACADEAVSVSVEEYWFTRRRPGPTMQ